MSLHVYHLINTIERGGAQTLVRDIVRTAPDDISFTVCALEEWGTMDTAFDEASAEVVSLGATRKLDPTLPLRLYRRLRATDVDVLHVHLPYAQVQGRLVGRLLGIPAIVSTQHNVPAEYHPVSRTLERVTRPLCDRVVAVSAGVANAFGRPSEPCGERGDAQWCTILNGLDVSAVDENLAAADTGSVTPPPSDGPVYLAVGRYVPAKDQRTLVDAMVRVVDEHADATLYLVGGGKLEDKLEVHVRERGLSDSVHLTGYVPDVYAYYRTADVFVSSSRREGLPITILEAMAARLPVAATAAPGVDEVVVDGETGRLVPVGGSRELGEAMVSATENAEAWGTAGRNRLAEQFTVERTVRSYLRLYQGLLE